MRTVAGGAASDGDDNIAGDGDAGAGRCNDDVDGAGCDDDIDRADGDVAGDDDDVAGDGRLDWFARRKPLLFADAACVCALFLALMDTSGSGVPGGPGPINRGYQK
jgi:hypothetical protein